MSYGPSSTLGLAYAGTNATTPPNVFLSDRAPNTGDWRNQMLGNIWIDNIHDNAYLLISLAMNQALWIQVAAATGDLSTLTGNSGGAVSPTAANINIVGDGSTVVVTGNPATSTLTIATGGSMAGSYVTDSGTAHPSAGILNIVGSSESNINTIGFVNTVQVELNQSIFIASMSTATFTPISQSMVLIGSSILADGTDADVGINITAQGNGSNVLTTSGTTITQDPTSIEFNTPQIEYSFVPSGSGTSTLSQFQNGNAINTTNNTATTIITSGTISAGNIVNLEYIVSGVYAAVSDSAFARVFVSAAYYSGAGSLVLVGTPIVDINRSTISANVTATIVANALVIQVTGVTAQTWEWTASGMTYISSI